MYCNKPACDGSCSPIQELAPASWLRKRIQPEVFGLDGAVIFGDSAEVRKAHPLGMKCFIPSHSSLPLRNDAQPKISSRDSVTTANLPSTVSKEPYDSLPPTTVDQPLSHTLDMTAVSQDAICRPSGSVEGYQVQIQG